MSNTMAQGWAGEIKRQFDCDLTVVSGEDIITSLMDPTSVALCRTHLGLPVKIEVTAATQIQQVRDGVDEDVARALEGKQLIPRQAVRIDADGRDSTDLPANADDATDNNKVE